MSTEQIKISRADEDLSIAFANPLEAIGWTNTPPDLMEIGPVRFSCE
ncbi:hypothetical protein GCM10011515_22090 [Tsuneonella deserti]|uniref:Uncharacterized protein n=1 Tax=Tsuneonella deserti TaxID=2035528 RepID=A0ABQ1SBL3_9SPHN|nr:hypothetical protein [Tsuneonella deserti]GGE02000.1 hypothetical protein GCM10011515_22090 [Tsuneonella deserti]